MGRIGVINELYVLPEWRSEGIGAMLIDEAKSLAEDRGWKRIEVTTAGVDYEKTNQFYQRGYQDWRGCGSWFELSQK